MIRILWKILTFEKEPEEYLEIKNYTYKDEKLSGYIKEEIRHRWRRFLINWKADRSTWSGIHKEEIKNKKHVSTMKRYRGQKSNRSTKGGDRGNEGRQ